MQSSLLKSYLTATQGETAVAILWRSRVSFRRNIRTGISRKLIFSYILK